MNVFSISSSSASGYFQELLQKVQDTLSLINRNLKWSAACWCYGRAYIVGVYTKMVKEISAANSAAAYQTHIKSLSPHSNVQTQSTPSFTNEQCLEPFKQRYICCPFELLENNFSNLVENFLPYIWAHDEKPQTGHSGREFSIGRNTSSEIHLNDPYFSRRHLLCTFFAGAKKGEYQLQVVNHENVKHPQLIYRIDVSTVSSQGKTQIIQPDKEHLVTGKHTLNDQDCLLLVGQNSVFKLSYSNPDSEQLPTIQIERAKIQQIEPSTA